MRAVFIRKLCLKVSEILYMWVGGSSVVFSGASNTGPKRSVSYLRVRVRTRIYAHRRDGRQDRIEYTYNIYIWRTDAHAPILAVQNTRNTDEIADEYPTRTRNRHLMERMQHKEEAPADNYFNSTQPRKKPTTRFHT